MEVKASTRMSRFIQRLGEHTFQIDSSVTDGWVISEEDRSAASFKAADAIATLAMVSEEADEAGRAAGERREAKIREILASGTPEDVVTRLQGALDAVERYRSGDDPKHNASIEAALARLRKIEKES
jgi:alkanesulfonate monooxygenase SsuD/methylene tetrahydromethanopterin reductase-like flavin-dependent oxidoreductase (luciferase family)